MAALIHLPWHGIVGARGELAHDIARIVQQQTMKTLCRRTTKLRNVSPLTSTVDCPDCRKAFADILRRERMRRITPRGARIAVEVKNAMDHTMRQANRIPGVSVDIHSYAVRYVPATNLIRVAIQTNEEEIAIHTPACHTRCAIGQISATLLIVRYLDAGEYEIESPEH